MNVTVNLKMLVIYINLSTLIICKNDPCIPVPILSLLYIFVKLFIKTIMLSTNSLITKKILIKIFN